MGEVGSGLDLVEEAFGTEGLRQLGIEDFDRDLPVVFQGLGQIDRRHPATTDLVFNPIAISQCLSEAFLVFHRG